MKGIIIALILAVVVIVAGLSSYVGAANYGAATEQTLLAKLNDNKNIRSNYALTIIEMAGVTKMYKKDLEDIIGKTFEGRYGKDGSKATWQWLQEQNPNLDPNLYARVQQVMESGRKEFTVSQTELLDLKREYQTNLNYLWRGFWLRLAGYPKIKLDDIKIIVDGNTEKLFEEGRDEAVRID